MRHLCEYCIHCTTKGLHILHYKGKGYIMGPILSLERKVSTLQILLNEDCHIKTTASFFSLFSSYDNIYYSHHVYVWNCSGLSVDCSTLSQRIAFLFPVKFSLYLTEPVGSFFQFPPLRFWLSVTGFLLQLELSLNSVWSLISS